MSVLLFSTILLVDCGSDDSSQGSAPVPVKPQPLPPSPTSSCALSWSGAQAMLRQNNPGSALGLATWSSDPVVKSSSSPGCQNPTIKYQVSNDSKTIYSISQTPDGQRSVPVVIKYIPSAGAGNDPLKLTAIFTFTDKTVSTVGVPVTSHLTLPPKNQVSRKDYPDRIDIFTGEVEADASGSTYATTGVALSDFYSVPIISDEANQYPATRDKNIPISFVNGQSLNIGGTVHKQYPNDGYGRYVACNDDEMAYMQIPQFDSSSQFDPSSQNFCSTNGSTDYKSNMQKYLSPICYEKFNDLISTFSTSMPGKSVCTSKGRSQDWVTFVSECQNGESDNCGKILKKDETNNLYFAYPYGAYPGDNYFPYRNSKKYYPVPVSKKLADLISDKQTNVLITDDPDESDFSVEHLRRVDWAFPKEDCSSKGCPVLIIFPGGGNQNMKGMRYTNNGTIASPSDAPFTDQWDWPESKGSPSSDIYSYGYYVRAQLLKAVINKGYAVVIVNPWPIKYVGKWDDWSFCPVGSKAGSCGAPWPGESDRERNFLKNFFGSLRDGEFKTGPSTDVTMKNKIDLNNIFIMGYSSGAQMVSRVINEFAEPQNSYWLPTTDRQKGSFADAKNLLKIKGAIMLSGGSYYTYSGLSDTTPSASSNNSCLPCTYDASDCDEFSNDLFPLGKVLSVSGCASAKMLEDNYMPGVNNDNPIAKKHPPVLLAQSNYDNDADRNASIFYYYLLNHYYPGKGYRISSNNPETGHHYFPEMVIPTVNFMQKYRTYDDDDRS